MDGIIILSLDIYLKKIIKRMDPGITDVHLGMR